MEEIHADHTVTVDSKFGPKTVIDPDWLDGVVKIEEREMKD